MKRKFDTDTLTHGLIVVGFIAFSVWMVYSHFEFASRMETTRQVFSQK